MTGFPRSKRGYKQIRGLPIVGGDSDVTLHNNEAKPNSLPNDPLYPKQWYIVSAKFSYFDWKRCVVQHLPGTWKFWTDELTSWRLILSATVFPFSKVCNIFVQVLFEK